MTEVMPLGMFQSTSMKGSSVQWSSAPWPRSSASIPQFTLGVQDLLMAFKKPGNTAMVRNFLDYVYQKGNYLKFVKDEGFLPTTKSASSAMASDPVTGEGIELLPSAKFYPGTDPAWTRSRARCRASWARPWRRWPTPARCSARSSRSRKRPDDGGCFAARQRDLPAAAPPRRLGPAAGPLGWLARA